jgi:RimJ/RimL family protein N-acetyltransferase
VILRRLSPADLPAFQAYRADPAVGRYQGWRPQPETEALAFIEEMAAVPLFPEGTWVQIGIAERRSNLLIGDIGMCVAAGGAAAEIGFSLSPLAQGNGLGTEAVQEAVRFLFQQTTVADVVGITDARNAPSVRLLERVGMRRVASRSSVFRGDPCIEHTYAISRQHGG